MIGDWINTYLWFLKSNTSLCHIISNKCTTLYIIIIHNSPSLVILIIHLNKSTMPQVIFEPSQVILFEWGQSEEALALSIFEDSFLNHVNIARIRVKFNHTKEFDVVFETIWMQPTCLRILITDVCP